MAGTAQQVFIDIHTKLGLAALNASLGFNVAPYMAVLEKQVIMGWLIQL